MIKELKKHAFLLKQLVLRDFKIKYKRSVLGIVWSLLYPLLILSVMAFVFSNMFKLGRGVANTNYIVYLMLGIVFFNFLQEATSVALGSVVDNFNLINKIYIPKYIFPLSKVLFVSINFILNLIPLFLIVILTLFGLGTVPVYIGFKYIFLIYDIVFMFLFILGLSFIFSTATVFLRDIKYLYGIILTLWNYLTPIFYDITLIPPTLQTIFKCNPMYQFITFGRKIILYGQIPSIGSFIAVALSGTIILLLGLYIFKKNQDKFIYYV